MRADRIEIAVARKFLKLHPKFNPETWDELQEEMKRSQREAERRRQALVNAQRN